MSDNKIIEKVKKIKELQEKIKSLSHHSKHIPFHEHFDMNHTGKSISTRDSMELLKTKTEHTGRTIDKLDDPKIIAQLEDYQKFLIEIFAATEMLSQFESSIDKMMFDYDEQYEAQSEEKVKQYNQEIMDTYNELNFHKYVFSFKNILDFEEKIKDISSYLDNRKDCIFSSKGYRLFIYCNNDMFSDIINYFVNSLTESDFSNIKSHINKIPIYSRSD